MLFRSRPSNSGVAQLKEKFSIKLDQLVIMGLGRLVEKKGFVYLIKAMPKILEKHKNVVFVIIGDGDQRKELEDLAGSLGVADYLRMPGYAPRDKAVQYYNMADIFVATSTRDKKGNLDDQPLSLLEAMSCQKPVVATALSGIKSIVSDGVNGFLFKDGNVLELSWFLNRLIESACLREKMAEESRRLSVEKFSIKRIGEYYTDVFNLLLNPV